MKTVLLVAALLWPVTFPGRETSSLSLPQPGTMSGATVSDTTTFFNPQRSAAVVRHCVSRGAKADWCDLTLVLALTGPRPLPQSHLRSLPGVTWSPDGQAVVASGERWGRLWTLQGVVRGLAFADQPLNGKQILRRSIEGVSFQGKRLRLTLRLTQGEAVCAAVTPERAPNAAVPRAWVVQRAYHWPSLRKGTAADDLACRPS